MLTIKDSSGVDLLTNPPEEQRDSVTGGAHAAISILVNAIEDDSALASQKIDATLDWNDGSQPTVFTGNGTVAVAATKGLGAGSYIVTFTAQNYRAPSPDIVSVNIPVVITRNEQGAPPRRLVYGPILPRDGGAPNTNTWNFDTKDDLFIIESSVKMLLITAKGERIVEPEYGTRLRRIVFEPNISGIESMVSEEITNALTTWEPRVQMAALAVNRNSDRSVTVTATFLSKLSQQAFDVNLEFTQ